MRNVPQSLASTHQPNFVETIRSILVHGNPNARVYKVSEQKAEAKEEIT